jgi:hypothetical protein
MLFDRVIDLRDRERLSALQLLEEGIDGLGGGFPVMVRVHTGALRASVYRAVATLWV